MKPEHSRCAICGDVPGTRQDDFNWWLYACSKGIQPIARLKRQVELLQLAGYGPCLASTRSGKLPWRVRKRFWELDHTKPRTLGGDDKPENLRVLCVPCHTATTKRLSRARASSKRSGKPVEYRP